MWDWMTFAVFSFQAWGVLPVFMTLLISSFVSPTLRCSASFVACLGGVSCPLPLDPGFTLLGLVACSWDQL